HDDRGIVLLLLRKVLRRPRAVVGRTIAGRTTEHTGEGGYNGETIERHWTPRRFARRRERRRVALHETCRHSERASCEVPPCSSTAFPRKHAYSIHRLGAEEAARDSSLTQESPGRERRERVDSDFRGARSAKSLRLTTRLYAVADGCAAWVIASRPPRCCA